MNTIPRRTIRTKTQTPYLALCAISLIALALPFAARPSNADVNGKLANIPRSEYQTRRQKLMEKIKDGIVVIIGAREEDLGEVGRFRQKNDLMYLTGVETPAASLLLIPAGLIPNKGASETVFIPQRNKMREQYTGFQVAPGPEAEQKFGVQEVASSDKFQDRLRDLFNAPPFKVEGGGRSTAKLYTVVPHGSTAAISRENQFVETVRKLAPHVQIADVSSLIAELRKLKSPVEIELLQKAIDITGEAQNQVARTIRPGVYEYEVQGALEYAFTRNGAERAGFPSIVGSGIYSTILHYNENRKKIEAGDVIVVDIGAEYSYYTADITRTYPATGKFTPRQRQVYELVLEAQRAAEKAFKPGESTLAQLQRAATAVMKASPLRDKGGKTLDLYFIHGLGHWLGMDVHDVGAYGPPIPNGAVFTIEPGIYIPDEKLGVRIEDDYLATEKGLIKMSARIPSAPDEIERLMSESRGSGVR
jgi:Xaa-Pro aminopeptidase